MGADVIIGFEQFFVLFLVVLLLVGNWWPVVSVRGSVGAGCVSDLGYGVSSGSVGGVHGSIGVGLIYSVGGVHGCVGVGCILPKELGVGVGDSAHGSVGLLVLVALLVFLVPCW